MTGSKISWQIYITYKTGNNKDYSLQYIYNIYNSFVIYIFCNDSLDYFIKHGV